MINIVLDVAGLVKKGLPSVKVVLGGPHISAVRGEALQSDAVDFAVFGEGEATLLELLTTIESGDNFAGVKGIAYKENGRHHVNTGRDPITDLDSLPTPLWDLFDFTNYHDFFIHGDPPYINLTTSRGCPYDCIFCGSKTTWGKKVRYHSAPYVLKELAWLAENGIHNISFVDDTFTLNKQRLRTICEGIVTMGINITFLCSSRVDTLDEEILVLLKKAGCKMITFGVESADEGVLKTIKKKTNLSQVRRSIALTKEAGIKTHTSYVIGCPGETRETVEKTIKFAIDMDPDYVQFSIFTPLPGTESWDYLDPQQKTSIDYSTLHWYGSYVLNSSGLSADYLITRQQEAYDAFKAQKERQKVRP
jgi:anaerobic magnesium-protoporphyrin IX monomethyl ester cyclase